MDCYWFCLHNTLNKRRTALINSEEGFRFIFSDSRLDVLGKDSLVVIEGRDLTNEVIDLASLYSGCIFVENYPVNVLTLQQISTASYKGIPIFWVFEDVMFYLKVMKKLKEATDKYMELIHLIDTVEQSHHSIKVSDLNYQIAIALGCDEESAILISIAGLFHDTGKLLIPQSLLQAPRWFTPVEKQVVKFHTVYGESLLKKVISNGSYEEPISYISINNTLLHHERLDGSGYPFQKVAAEISLVARITAVSDVYSAIRSDRPYRSACDHELAISYLKANSQQFDQKIVKILNDIVSNLNTVKCISNRNSQPLSFTNEETGEYRLSGLLPLLQRRNTNTPT